MQRREGKGPAFEEGLFPLTRRDGDVDLDEERRLLFVGITRAIDRCILTRARRRVVAGRPLELPPSSFEDNLGEEAVPGTRVLPGRRRRVQQLLLI